MITKTPSVTLADFDQFLRQPDHADRHFELIDGEIVEKLVTVQHGIIAVNIAAAIKTYLKVNPIGRVAVEARHQAADDIHNERLPDVSFIAGLDRMITTSGAVPNLPDLAVEIKSPDDTYKQIRRKARFYLNGETQLVWLIFPEKQLVETYSTDDEQILTLIDVLSGANVLPGFTMPVREIFDL